MRVAAWLDVLKVWIWVGASLLLAVIVTPAVYNGGKALGEVSRSKDFSEGLDWIGKWSRQAELGDFFVICWGLLALVLFLPFAEWLGLGKRVDALQPKGPWGVRLPSGAGGASDQGQRLRSNSWGLVQGLTGFCLTLGVCLLIGYAMLKAGSFMWRENAGGWREGLLFEMVRVVALAAMLEVFFRSVVLGVFLRAMKPLVAISLVAVLFGIVHYLAGAFGRVDFGDGEDLRAMKLLVGVLFGGDLGSRFFLTFVPWFVLGWVLGWSRWRTASLWLPVGLLSGWLLADRLFEKAASGVPMEARLARQMVTASLHEGLFPLLGLVAVGCFVIWITQVYVRIR